MLHGCLGFGSSKEHSCHSGELMGSMMASIFRALSNGLGAFRVVLRNAYGSAFSRPGEFSKDDDAAIRHDAAGSPGPVSPAAQSGAGGDDAAGSGSAPSAPTDDAPASDESDRAAEAQQHWDSESFSEIDFTVFASSQPKTSDEYVPDIAKLIESETSDSRRRRALDVLQRLVALTLSDNQLSGEWLLPPVGLDGIPKAALQNIVGKIDRVPSAEVRARIADAAWLRGRAGGYQVAQRAARDYVTSARELTDVRNSRQRFVRVQRALCLALSLGRAEALAREIVEATTAMLRDFAAEDSRFPLLVIRLLLDVREGDPAEFIRIASAQVEATKSAGDLYRCREYLEVQAQCLRKANLSDDATRAMIEVAKLLAVEASSYAETEHGRWMAANLLGQALEVLRGIGTAAAKDELNRLKLELLRVRAASLESLPHQSLGSTSVADLIEHARAQVRGRTVMEALAGLITLEGPVDVDRLRERSRDAVNRSFAHHIASTQRFTRSGRLDFQSPGLGGGDDESVVETQMHAELGMFHQVFAYAGILPAVRELQLEHGLRQANLAFLASQSPFVPPGRGLDFAKGLAFGLMEDFTTAAHLLVPQFENALRWHLGQLGVATVTLPTAGSGVENEFDLGDVLKHPRLQERFDASSVFDWRSLLTERAGANLRNELAHGLIEPGSRTLEFVYLWWTVLRCVITPFLNARVDEHVE